MDVWIITLQWSGAMSRPTVVCQSKNEWQPPVFVRLVPLYVKSLCKASINLKLQYPNPLPGWAFEYENFGLFKFLLSTLPQPPTNFFGGVKRFYWQTTFTGADELTVIFATS